MAETTRYDMVKKPNKEVETRQKTYWKYHITAVLGLWTILATAATPNNVHDTTVLPTMSANVRRQGFDVSGSIFSADKAHVFNGNCAKLFQMDMTPNIKM